MTRRPPRSLLATGIVIGMWLTACESASPPPDRQQKTSPVSTHSPEDPSEQFAGLEQRLLAAAGVRITGTITSEGAVESSLAGTLLLKGKETVNLDYSGVFASRSADPHLRSDGKTMSGGSSAGLFEQEAPGGLREALLIGATRMGLLHNLAMLSSGSPPDRMDGTIREWVQVSDLARRPGRMIAGQETHGLTFNITVDGKPAGAAVLWIAKDSGLPVQREQTVHFDSGDMRVMERYEIFELDEMLRRDR